MANISPYVSQILSAIYGEEVRGSIVNALNAMNNDINVDMITLKDLETKTKTNANNAATYATNAANSASASSRSAETARGYAEEASISASHSTSVLLSARLYAESASASANNASASAYESNEALKSVQEFISKLNYENIYDFIREKILFAEGYFADLSIEDSNGDPILDSNGNPIGGRELLDPIKFADIYKYVMIFFMKEDNLQKLIDAIKDKIYAFVFQNILSNDMLYEDIYKYVLNKQ